MKKERAINSIGERERGASNRRGLVIKSLIKEGLLIGGGAQMQGGVSIRENTVYTVSVYF